MVEDGWNVLFPVLQLRTALLILIWMVPLVSLTACLLSHLLSLSERCWHGVVVGNAVFVNCTHDMTIVFIYSILQTYTGFSYVRKVAIFFWAGPIVDHVE